MKGYLLKRSTRVCCYSEQFGQQLHQLHGAHTRSDIHTNRVSNAKQQQQFQGIKMGVECNRISAQKLIQQSVEQGVENLTLGAQSSARL